MEVDTNMAQHTPSNPTKAPKIPTGPRASAKGSASKVMKPMSKAGKTVPKGGFRNKTKVDAKASNQTVDGGPRS